MEHGSSSGTRVFVGPLTVEEIRYTLELEVSPESIGRRRSISEANPSRTVYAESPTQDYLFKQRFFGCETNCDYLSDSFISAYLTPNETLHNDKSAATSDTYATPCESLQNSPKEKSIRCDLHPCSTSRIGPDADKENFIKQMLKASNRSSRRSSLYASARQSSNFNSPKFSPHQTNKECDTILVLSDDDNYDNKNNSNLSEISNNEVADENIQKHNDSSQIYVISSDSSFEEDEEIKIKPEQSSRLSLQENDKSVEIIDLEASESATSRNASEHDNSETSSVCFNDTLDEMEMALKYGLDYMMPEERTDTSRSNISSSDCSSPKGDAANLSSGWSASEPQPKNNKVKKSAIPTKISTTNITPQKAVGPMNLLSTKQDFNFKVPPAPGVTRKAPDFKNVLSPVAVYINSQRVPQVQRIATKPLISGPLFPNLPLHSATDKENEQLPYRLYRPAKHTVESKENEFKLPGSMQKYMPNTPEITKHQGRIAAKEVNSVSVEEQLLLEDLTICDASLQDVSLHTIKKLYMQ